MPRTLIAVVLGMLILMTTSTAVLADPRDFTLANASDVTITHAYVSPAEAMSWEEDVLGSGVLASGESVDVVFSGFTADACFYDIKVLAADGREGYLYGVDLCSTTLVAFS